MEDNNNLEDFFRKRLSSVDDNDANWFNPDPMTDQLVLGKLTASKNSSRSQKISRALLALLFLLLLGYIAHLKNSLYNLSKVNTPPDAAHISTQQIAKIKQIDPKTNKTETDVTIIPTNESLDTKNSNSETDRLANIERKKKAQAAIEYTKKIAQQSAAATQKLATKNNTLKAENNTLATENNTLTTQYQLSKTHAEALQALAQQQNKRIQALENELKNNDCYQQNKNADLIPILAGQQEQNSTSNEFLDPTKDLTTIINSTKKIAQQNANALADSMAVANLAKNTAANNAVLDENALLADLAHIQPALFPLNTDPETVEGDVPFLIQKKKRRFHSLEFGMEVGLHGLVSGIDRSIENQRLAFANSPTSTTIMPMHGVNLAYSPIKNFWIRLGARIGGISSLVQHKLGVVYNDNDQYQLPSGTKAHDFVLNTNTNYTRFSNDLSLTIPQNTINGDLFELEYFEFYDLIRVQVPITTEYYFGSKKFQPMIHLGLQWNMLNYEYQVSSFDIISRDQAIDFSEPINARNSQSDNIHFIGISTGAGLNWNIRPHFSLRGQFAYETNVMFQTATAMEATTNSGFNFKFGLYFKF